jgi:hypothetical protein
VNIGTAGPPSVGSNTALIFLPDPNRIEIAIDDIGQHR